VNKYFGFLLLFVFFSNCSLDKKTGLWSEDKKIKTEEVQLNSKELFTEEKNLQSEVNPSLKINLTGKLIKNSFINNYDNNNGRIDFNGNLEGISKFKFSKIDNFKYIEPELVFEKNNLLFFDNNGSILKFNQKSRLLWKKNYYTKIEKKLKPILFFANNKKHLIVVDNTSKYYSLDIESGELLWSQNNSSPFNSQVKIYKENFFVIDYENILRCYSIKDGKEIWSIETEKSFIRTQKKLSLVVIDGQIIFNNSIGDIGAVNIDSGNLIWQTPTQSSAIYEDAFLLKTSDLIADNDVVLFSNNKNEFFSLDIRTGNINWKQKINSTLRSTLVDNLIFSVSMEGFLIITEKRSGAIIRATDIFKVFKPKQRSKIKPIGFILGSKNIYLTTSHGRLITIAVKNGEVLSIQKIDNSKISRPFTLKQNIFIVRDNGIIKLN
jgi:outer membrane protein assembly factor BamB